MSQAHGVAPPAPEELYVHPRRDLGTNELWERSLTRSRERRARALEGAPRRRTLLSEAMLDLDAPLLVRVAPSHDRDLTSEELWDLSGALARARRRAAAKPVLTQARTAGASLVVAAIAASVPLQSSAHTRSSRSAASAVDTRLLRFGSRGADVASVQRKLGIPADGIFGPQTRRAVKRFQARHGLAVDGIVGPQTRASLARSGSGGGGFQMFRAPWVDDVQRKLGIPADGVFGPQTRAAVMAFQARKGLVVDGIVGPRTRAALGLSQGGGSSGGQSGSQSPSTGSSRAATAVRAATSQIGDRYAWGGDGPGSWDCSGLTMWSFRQAGISLPHSSRMQYGYGRAVSSRDIRAGDLVFFSTNGPGASHVGIATSSRSFVSATSHGVRIQSIFDSYWGGNYVGARRIA